MRPRFGRGAKAGRGRPGRRDAAEAPIVAMAATIPGHSWKGLAASASLGDGLYRLTSWPAGLCIMLEVKGEKTRIEPHQADLAAEGWTRIVRSPEDVLAVIDAVRRWSRGGPLEPPPA